MSDQTFSEPSAPAAARNPMRGDLTQGPILKTLMLFSIPTLIGNVLQTLSGTVNSIWVGRLIGNSALAATANANIVLFLSFSAFFGFGMATTVRMGQCFGARDIDGVRRNFGTGLGFCVGLSALVGLVGFVYTDKLLHLLATPADSQKEALDYLQVVFLQMPLGTLSVLLSMGLRGAGDAKTPLYAMILTVVVDIALNPLLIRGVGPVPALGITGSALSTCFANGVGALLMLVVIYARDLPVRLRGRELAYLIPRKAELGFIIGKGFPMGMQMFIVSSAGLVMIGLVNREGMITTAAYGASQQLWNYLQMPAMAIASAVSAMVAQNVGAGRHDRVRQITLQGLAACTGLTFVMAVGLVLGGKPMLALFLGAHSPALPVAAHMQLLVTWSFVVMGVMMILSGTMRAYGAVIAPLVVMFVSLYPARLGFYALAYPHMGAEALWWAYPFGSIVSGGLMVAVYARPGWRHPAAGGPAPAPAPAAVSAGH
jgi:putative MATE family efflux protein